MTLKTDLENGYKISIDGHTYNVDVVYTVNSFGDKKIPKIHGIKCCGIDLLPIIKIEIVEDIRSFLFKKKNNITT